MDRVPGDVIYGLTLDGKGGMTPLAEGSEIPCAQPGWLHLDYGNPESARWLLQTPLLGGGGPGGPARPEQSSQAGADGGDGAADLTRHQPQQGSQA